MSKAHGKVDLEKSMELFKEFYSGYYKNVESYTFDEEAGCININLLDGHTAVWYPVNDVNVVNEIANKNDKNKKSRTKRNS